MLGFKIKRINFKICFAIPFKLTIILDFVRTIALNILRSLKIIYKYYVAPLLAAFTLENTKIHVSILNSYDETFYVEALINDFFADEPFCESQISIYTIVILK